MEILAGIVRGAATSITTITNALGPFRYALGALATVAGVAVGALALLRTGIAVYSLVVPAATTATGAFNRALNLNPIILATVAILGLVAAISALIIWWTRARDTVGDGLVGRPSSPSLGSLGGGRPTALAAGNTSIRNYNVTVNANNANASGDEIARAFGRVAV